MDLSLCKAPHGSPKAIQSYLQLGRIAELAPASASHQKKHYEVIDLSLRKAPPRDSRSEFQLLCF